MRRRVFAIFLFELLVSCFGAPACTKTEEISTCFRGLVNLSPKIPDCPKYDYLENCFAYESNSCSIELLAEIASEAYLTEKQIPIPPTIILKMYRRLSLKCRKSSQSCSQRDLEVCTRSLTGQNAQKDKMHHQEFLSHVELFKKSLPTRVIACRKLRSTLNFWATFRKDVCGPLFASCLCLEVAPKLQKLGCNVQCAHVSHSSSGTRRTLRDANSGSKFTFHGVAIFLAPLLVVGAIF